MRLEDADALSLTYVGIPGLEAMFVTLEMLIYKLCIFTNKYT